MHKKVSILDAIIMLGQNSNFFRISKNTAGITEDNPRCFYFYIFILITFALNVLITPDHIV
jgi:hypothetical protein